MRIEGHVVASALVIKLPMAGKVSRQHWEARNASKTCRGGDSGDSNRTDSRPAGDEGDGRKIGGECLGKCGTRNLR
jgi:hypothetical protein